MVFSRQKLVFQKILQGFMSAVQMDGRLRSCARVTDTRKTPHSAEDVH